ncbi:MAG: multicopper oxidase domain-containing protein [Oligoflexia bacterium]|nr:multicopper oxidase domain-containing protein [Oligoflexia bacterium]
MNRSFLCWPTRPFFSCFSYFFCIFFLFFYTTTSFSTPLVPQPIMPCDPLLASSMKYVPTATEMMNGNKLSWQCDGNVKVFELTAEEVFNTITDELESGPIYTWGYNGSVPGPVIEAIEGETVRIVFKNRLPDPTTVHWHGIHLPIEMDGGSGHSHPPIPPGGTYIYEFTLKQSGTYIYHSGHDLAKQLSMGSSGFFIIHPKKIPETIVNHDFLVFLHMWTIPPHSQIPDTMDMEFNFFTINGKSFPNTSQMKVKVGDKVRIRFANLSMMAHPIHLHGHTWRVVANGAGDDPTSAMTFSNTVHVPTGRNMDVIIDKIDEPGEWMFHCHLPHHVTNNMHGMEPVPGESHGHAHAGMFTLFNVLHDGDHENMAHNGHAGADHLNHLKNAPRPGLYKGQIQLENGRILQANLDLFKIQIDKKWRRLSAFLKIFLGGEGSAEYLVFNYMDLKYHFENKVLSVQRGDKGVSLFDIKFMEHDKEYMLTGKIRSDYSGITGTINMHLERTSDDGPVDGHSVHHSSNGHISLSTENTENRKNTENSLAGEYEGSCKSEEKTKRLLQIETLRGLSDSNKEGNPFFPYLITGRLGKLSPSDTRTGNDVKEENDFRVETIIHAGSYDIFEGNLQLQIDPFQQKDSLKCKLGKLINGGTELKCDDCTFVKVKSPFNFISTNEISTNEISTNKPQQNWESLVLPKSPKVNQFTLLPNYSGSYFGLLYHEKRGIYQKVMLEVNVILSSIMSMQIPTPSISATLNLYFGDVKSGNKDKLISYKFPLRPFLDSSSLTNTNGRNQLGLIGENAFFVVEKWEENSIEGYFFHNDFGRVGKIQLIKGKEFPKIPSHWPLISEGTGNFSFAEHTLSLDFLPTENLDFTDGNPFTPLTIKGRYFYKNGVSSFPIERGSYDFFTGNLSLLLEGSRVISGKYSDNPSLTNREELSAFISSIGKRRVKILRQVFMNYHKNVN